MVVVVRGECGKCGEVVVGECGKCGEVLVVVVVKTLGMCKLAYRQLVYA